MSSFFLFVISQFRILLTAGSGLLSWSHVWGVSKLLPPVALLFVFLTCTSRVRSEAYFARGGNEYAITGGLPACWTQDKIVDRTRKIGHRWVFCTAKIDIIILLVQVVNQKNHRS